MIEVEAKDFACYSKHVSYAQSVYREGNFKCNTL